MTSVEQNIFRIQTASSNTKAGLEADEISLKWEDFFEKEGADDLLPCLMGVYDNIAGKEFEKVSTSVVDSKNDDRVAAVQNLEETIRELKRRSTMLEEMVDGKQSVDHSNRPYSLTSEISSSSISSAVSSSGRISIGVSSASSSCCSSRSDLSSNVIRRHLSNNGMPKKNCYLASEESLTEASPRKSDDQGAVQKSQCNNVRLLSYTPKVTSGSQYSEDSGVFSSLQTSESINGQHSYSYEESLDYSTKVILEIVETEAVYVNDLQQIIEGYLEEWKNKQESGLTNEQINDLFGNIEEIYDFNRCFLWELEQCGLNPIKIARCFVENNSNFSIYATYCTNYPRSVAVLTDLMRQEKTACVFRDRQISLQHTLPLGSYLLKPVQRILKYHLLLQNMVKHSSSDSIGYNDITVALSTMTGIAHHINNMKRRHEHAVRVQEVQSLLVDWEGPDLAVFGELYAEGTFRISGVRALRHIFLFEHMLLVTKKKYGGVLHYKTHIICSNLMLVECLPKEPLSFQIIPFDNPRLQLTVRARSIEEKRHWALEIKRVILENYNVEIPSHARQLVMELGQVQHLANNLSLNKIIYKRQHSTPEYLERRRTDKHRKKTFRSHLAPLIRKSDLLGTKIQNKFRKNNIHSHGNSIKSGMSVNSLDVDNDETSEKPCENNDRCKVIIAFDDFDRTSGKSVDNVAHRRSQSLDNGISSSSNSSSCSSNYDKKEKAIEEIIGQLILENKKFQLAIKSTESVQDDATDYEALYENRLRGILKYVRRNDNNNNNIDNNNLNKSNDANNDDGTTSLDNLSCGSLNIPNSPTVWLKQQDEHLARPSKKADSLPRTFQMVVNDDSWKSTRPKTIASDQPVARQMMKLTDNDNNLNDGHRRNRCSRSCILLTDSCNDNKSLIAASSSDLSTATPRNSMHNLLHVHPECKFYRTSVTRLTLFKMLNNLSAKIANLKLQLEEQSSSMMGGQQQLQQFYDKQPDNFEEKNIFNVISASAYNNHNNRNSDNDNYNNTSMISYRQGSSKLGARIARCTELTDYADPRVLFPTITPSKKAASILGIRPFTSSAYMHAIVEQDDSQRKIKSTISANNNNNNNNNIDNCIDIDGIVKTTRSIQNQSPAAVADNVEQDESDYSMDSFYERKFEQMENLLIDTSESCRNSFLFDYESINKIEQPLRNNPVNVNNKNNYNYNYNSERNNFAVYSHLTPNISIHKPIRIPPPVPTKPKTTIRVIPHAKRFAVAELKKQVNNSKQVTVMDSSLLPTRGWVRQVVDKIQATNE